MRYVAALMCMALVGCAELADARRDPPRASWTSARPFDDVAACVIAALDAKSQIRHAMVTVVPGKRFEIQPTRTIVAGAEPYFAVLTIDGEAVRLDYHSSSPAFNRYASDVGACA